MQIQVERLSNFRQDLSLLTFNQQIIYSSFIVTHSL